jgi:hypothetical protein
MQNNFTSSYGTIIWNTLASSHKDHKNIKPRNFLCWIETKKMFSHFVKLTPKLFWYVTVTEHKPKDIHAVKKVHQPPAWFRFSFLPNKIVFNRCHEKGQKNERVYKMVFQYFLFVVVTKIKCHCTKHVLIR